MEMPACLGFFIVLSTEWPFLPPKYGRCFPATSEPGRAVSTLEFAAVPDRHDRGAEGREPDRTRRSPATESITTESGATIRVESASAAPARLTNAPTIREFNMVRAPLPIGGGVDPKSRTIARFRSFFDEGSRMGAAIRLPSEGVCKTMTDQKITAHPEERSPTSRLEGRAVIQKMRFSEFDADLWV